MNQELWNTIFIVCHFEEVQRLRSPAKRNANARFLAIARNDNTSNIYEFD